MDLLLLCNCHRKCVLVLYMYCKIVGSLKECTELTLFKVSAVQCLRYP